jgi:phosphoribosylaminoimidazole-succinocarboxamide synthase
VITPTTKAAAYEHDLEITPQEILDRGYCQPKIWERVTEYSQKLFAFGTELLAQKGWILVDTKYEFGLTPGGELLVIDEIHTPDSSRFWVSQTYGSRLAEGLPPVMLDKERIRRWLLEQGYKGEGAVPEVPLANGLDLATTYLDVLETLSPQPALTMGVYGESALLRSIPKII